MTPNFGWLDSIAAITVAHTKLYRSCYKVITDIYEIESALHSIAFHGAENSATRKIPPLQRA